MIKLLKAHQKGPVETFSKTWELVFGKFHLYVDKVIYQREVEFEKFKEQFKKEISSVPENNLQEPQFSLPRSCSRSFKVFTLVKKTLSNMFAKLIASSMDDRKNSLTQPFIC
ncbi:DUF4393 domain-containing protein [Staphylococcus aureus]|uniref:DUF4393 domain-containing protein n=1 Tax=Staphylococcus aureus TaxID=1280 RepID=UPI000DFD6262|nr:DUF4393 domain-containing protein [Staphylococcus aureus]SUL38183.1 Uncharacterised protein [Staphylococcus aureus]